MSGMSIASSYDKAFDFSRGLFTEGRDVADQPPRFVFDRRDRLFEIDLLSPPRPVVKRGEELLSTGERLTHHVMNYSRQAFQAMA